MTEGWRVCARLAGLLGVLLTAACSGGGGDGGSSVRVGFGAASSSAGEGQANVALTVELTTSSALSEAVSVEVSDLASGSATSSFDYSPLASSNVVFPAGSVSGAVQTVMLQLSDDALVEGDEEIELELRNVQGTALGSVRRHTLTIADADQATVQFGAGASATADEADGTAQIAIELGLAPGDSLAIEIGVEVADAGGGSATSGSDYSAFGPQTVLFAVGASNGASASVGVEVRDDLDLEGDETLMLTLTSNQAAVQLGANQTHALTITEDDLTQEPFLTGATGTPGNQAPIANGDSLDLGAQALGGSGAPIGLSFANLGIDPMNLSAPSLSGADVGDFSVEFDASGSLAAAASSAPQGLPSPFTPAAQAAGQGLTPNAAQSMEGVALELDTSLLAELGEHSAVTLHDVPTPVGALDLELRRVASPWARDAVLAVDGEPVEGGPEALLGDLSLWSGELLGRPGSAVFLALSSQGSNGWIRLSNIPGDELSLESDGTLGSSTPRARLAWAAERPLAASGSEPPFCSESRSAPADEVPGRGFLAPHAETAAGYVAANCRLAIETDYQLFQKLGSSAATTTYVTELIAAVSARYQTDVQTTLSIAYLGIYTDPGDPWATPDTPGSAGDMIDEFRAAWAPSFGGNWPVEADLAHFISGASLGGGIAYLGTLCSDNFGFGVSGSLHGAIDWQSWDESSGSFTWDFVVVAHELGHNFSARHTHAYCPPLDHCASNCDDQSGCGQGTLMSYCHTCGGMSNIQMAFHPFVANEMRQEVNNSCLDVSSVGPGEGASYLIRLEPSSGPGFKSAALEFTHDATNTSSPFQIQLTGNATP